MSAEQGRESVTSLMRRWFDAELEERKARDRRLEVERELLAWTPFEDSVEFLCYGGYEMHPTRLVRLEWAGGDRCKVTVRDLPIGLPHPDDRTLNCEPNGPVEVDASLIDAETA